MTPRYAAVLIFLILLTGCGAPTVSTPNAAPPSPPPPSPPPPTAQPPPTATLEPTATATNTPLPEGVIFRDEFNGNLQPGWEWDNEDPARWELTDDGWLQIIGSPESLLGDDRQSNLLWHALPEGDFVITSHLQTNPFANFHQATIYIYEDPDNYIALNRGFCDICAAGGGGFYMEYKVGGNFGAYNVATDAEDVYLRLESSNNMISGYYGLAPGEWTRIGRFGNYFQFTRVGIGVSNVGSPQDVVGRFDYFEIAVP